MLSEEKIKELYKEKMGKELNLEDPRDLNEKIQWLNLYKQNSLKVKCTDKYRMREYVEEKELGEYLPKLLGVYESGKQIDFDKLPNKFVLKCNHASGPRFYVICKDKSMLNIKETINKLDDGLKVDFSLYAGEFQYSKIVPRIICEELLEESGEDVPKDYKIFCINGEPQFFQVCANRGKKLTFSLYDLEWNNINYKLGEGYYNENKIKKPKSINKMLEIAKKLSTDFDFVRVDFYEINGKPIIGELTFTPNAGRLRSISQDFLNELGQKLIINKRIY